MTMRSIGLDLGSREVSFCEVRSGKVVARRTASSVEMLNDLLGPGTAPARVAIEACREAWQVHDLLTSWGHEVLLVDTTRARRLGIGQHGRKTDRVDAEALAQAVERGGIPTAHLLSPARRELRDELHVRQALVETRAQYITTIRGLVRAHAEKLERCATDDFTAKLRDAKLPPRTRELIEPLAQMLVLLDQQIASVNARLEKLCGVEPVIERLTTTPGVGLIVSAAFVSVIDDAKRFQHAHQVESYLGLVPSEDTSGGRDKRRLGSITKHGNPYLRAMLIQAAWAIWRVRDDDPLKRWGHAVAKRRGKRIAVVAMARRLAGVLWALWRDGTVYDAARVGQAIARGLNAQAQSIEVHAQAMKRAADKAHRRRKDIERTQPNAPVPGGRARPRTRTSSAQKEVVTSS